jgi:hypothetical protein
VTGMDGSSAERSSGTLHREHERALVAGETTLRYPKPAVSHDTLRRVDDMEAEMRKKLAAMANFNEPERAMLLKVLAPLYPRTQRSGSSRGRTAKSQVPH